MAGPIHALLSRDHDRLDALLSRAVGGDGSLDMEAYLAFRAGLARHIGMEEKILFPAARRSGVIDERLPFERLRADHGRLVWLLNWVPTAELVAEIRGILEPHNELEEMAQGVYEACESLVGDDLDDLLRQLESAPPTPMRPPQQRRR